MKTVCSWCQKTISGEGEEVSHGICQPCERRYFPVPSGVWAVCVPVGSEELPEFRHLFDGEEKLWGCAGITTRCNVTYALKSTTVFIGGVSIPKSREACPECLDSLNRKEVIA